MRKTFLGLAATLAVGGLPGGTGAALTEGSAQSLDANGVSAVTGLVSGSREWCTAEEEQGADYVASRVMSKRHGWGRW